MSVPNNESAIAAHRHFATKPHIAGSEQDLVTAKDFLHVLQRELRIAQSASGDSVFDAGSYASRNATLSITNLTKPTAWIDKYFPVMNRPLNRSLEILDSDGNAIWTANLEEVGDPLDPEAEKNSNAVPAFHGLSCDGDVRGQLVYANLGRKEDYDALVKAGVSLTGKIVLTRYGGIFRGLKVKGAQDLGAAGVLIFNDPKDDGTVTPENGYDTYPHGPARNPTSLQRGSVQFLSVYPGDPTTPGYPSYENATRTEGTNIPKIPSLPISWNNAKILLAEIGLGPLAGKAMNRTVRLVNHVDNKVIPIWNTMGVIPGSVPDEVIVIGNHRDAWVMGATDPSSGTASMHEVIRGFGTLLSKGWKPLRTIVIASWDAEEYGLIGSTEWGEDFADWIDKHVVAYLNVDSSVSGSRLRLSASPSLAHMVRSTAEKVPHPKNSSLTLWDARTDVGSLFGNGTVSMEDVAERMEVQGESVGVNPLGSGSDYTVFLQRIGVASANGGFGSTLSDPVYHYHSVYDTIRWQEVWTDPGFHKHVAIAKHLGLQALRLADLPILPINTTHYALELDNYLDKVEGLVASGPLSGLNLLPFRSTIRRLQLASAKLDVERAILTSALEGRSLREVPDLAQRVKKVNKALAAFERGFISETGIPEREWYRHLGVAPGKWLGYGATTFPALTEAIKYDRSLERAQDEVARLIELVELLAVRITPGSRKW